MKKCSRCLESKSIEYFYKNNKNRDGYLHQCKTCVACAHKRFRLENLDKLKEKRKLIYWSNRESAIRSAIDWGKNNKEKRKVYKDRWRNRNRALVSHYSKVRYARERGALGSYTQDAYLDKFKMVNGLCVYCGIRPGNTRDHVVPLTRGGTNTIDNIVPACLSCNSSKKNKLLSEWKK